MSWVCLQETLNTANLEESELVLTNASCDHGLADLYWKTAVPQESTTSDVHLPRRRDSLRMLEPSPNHLECSAKALQGRHCWMVAVKPCLE